jgi:hypothetical protein
MIRPRLPERAVAVLGATSSAAGSVVAVARCGLVLSAAVARQLDPLVGAPFDAYNAVGPGHFGAAFALRYFAELARYWSSAVGVSPAGFARSYVHATNYGTIPIVGPIVRSAVLRSTEATVRLVDGAKWPLVAGLVLATAAATLFRETARRDLPQGAVCLAGVAAAYYGAHACFHAALTRVVWNAPVAGLNLGWDMLTDGWHAVWRQGREWARGPAHHQPSVLDGLRLVVTLGQAADADIVSSSISIWTMFLVGLSVVALAATAAVLAAESVRTSAAEAVKKLVACVARKSARPHWAPLLVMLLALATAAALGALYGAPPGPAPPLKA